MVKFNATEEEFDLIIKIIIRAQKLGLSSRDNISDQMDLIAVHSNGTPLDFNKFLEFNDSNFCHDYTGIRNTIDRKTGKLTHCFLPRCSKSE